MTTCPIHGPQNSLPVSPDVVVSLHNGLSHPSLLRIDVYVDSEQAGTFFVSTSYCDHAKLPSIHEVIYSDAAEFDAQTVWIRDMIPCCGVCFTNRYPNAITAPAPEVTDEMKNGYTVAQV